MADERPLEGKTALVTGAGRNLGRAIALELAAHGANIVASARSNRAEAEAVAEEARAFDVSAIAILADVGDSDAVAAVAARSASELGGIDIYVSCVAMRPHQSLADTSIDEWHTAIETNLSASFYLAKAITPSMVEGGWGRIIHIGGGFDPARGRLHTLTTKNGLLGLTRALASELGPHGITANLVAPGSLRPKDGTPPSPEAAAKIPVGRFGEAEDVAWACAFLASPRSGFITGQVVHVNGGTRML